MSVNLQLSSGAQETNLKKIKRNKPFFYNSISEILGCKIIHFQYFIIFPLKFKTFESVTSSLVRSAPTYTCTVVLIRVRSGFCREPGPSSPVALGTGIFVGKLFPPYHVIGCSEFPQRSRWNLWVCKWQVTSWDICLS